MHKTGRFKAKRFAKQRRWRAAQLDRLNAWFKDMSLRTAVGINGAGGAGRRQGKDECYGPFSSHIDG